MALEILNHKEIRRYNSQIIVIVISVLLFLFCYLSSSNVACALVQLIWFLFPFYRGRTHAIEFDSLSSHFFRLSVNKYFCFIHASYNTYQPFHIQCDICVTHSPNAFEYALYFACPTMLETRDHRNVALEVANKKKTTDNSKMPPKNESKKTNGFVFISTSFSYSLLGIQLRST